MDGSLSKPASVLVAPSRSDRPKREGDWRFGRQITAAVAVEVAQQFDRGEERFRHFDATTSVSQ